MVIRCTKYMSDEALILNVIAQSKPACLLSAWLKVYATAHPEASENKAREAYSLACGDWEAV
ncbi:hypothetical protein [Bacteriophage sp.]|nr:hypothetical protein [Bacteriophage sp.]